MLCEVEWNENFTQVSLYKHISFNHIFQIRGCERRSEAWNAQRRHDFQRKAFAFPLSIYQICISIQIIRTHFCFHVKNYQFSVQSDISVCFELLAATNVIFYSVFMMRLNLPSHHMFITYVILHMLWIFCCKLVSFTTEFINISTINLKALSISKPSCHKQHQHQICWIINQSLACFYRWMRLISSQVGNIRLF